MPPSRRQLLASACTLPATSLLAGCYAPAPEKLELTVPPDADGAVTATVTLLELPGERERFESTYTVAPAHRVSAGDFAEGADYRLRITIDDAVRWEEPIRANQFYVLELRPEGQVTVAETGWYESTAAAD